MVRLLTGVSYQKKVKKTSSTSEFWFEGNRMSRLPARGRETNTFEPKLQLMSKQTGKTASTFEIPFYEST